MLRQPKAFVGKAVCGDFREPLPFAFWQVLAPDSNRLSDVADVFSGANLPRCGCAGMIPPARENFGFVEEGKFAGDANPHFQIQCAFQIGVESSQLLISGTSNRNSRALDALCCHERLDKILQLSSQ